MESEQIFKCKKPYNNTDEWKNVGGRLSQIDGGGYTTCTELYNSGNVVYSRPIDGSKAWRRFPSVAMKHIMASGNDDIFSTSRTGDVYRCSKPCIGDWEKMSTDYRQLSQLDASYDAIFGVSMAYATRLANEELKKGLSQHRILNHQHNNCRHISVDSLAIVASYSSCLARVLSQIIQTT